MRANVQDGPIDAPKTIADVRQEPYNLPDRFAPSILMSQSLNPLFFCLHSSHSGMCPDAGEIQVRIEHGSSY